MLSTRLKEIQRKNEEEGSKLRREIEIHSQKVSETEKGLRNSGH